MNIMEIISRAKQDIVELTRLSLSGVVGGSKKDDGWHIGIELVEKRAIPDGQDLLGFYDVLMDDEGQLLSYERKMMRRRIDTDVGVVD